MNNNRPPQQHPNNGRYNQPPPQKGDRMSMPNQPTKPHTAKQGNPKGQPNKQQIQQRPKQNDFLILLNYLSNGLNRLGLMLLSDKFIGGIQNILQEHLDLLNYILQNLTSKSFWALNLKYSVILTAIFLIKGLFGKNFLSFEMFAIISGTCFLVLKILDSKGDTLESRYSVSDYKEDIEFEEEEIENEVYNYSAQEESDTSLEEEIPLNSKEEYFESNSDDVENEPIKREDTDSEMADVFENIQKMFREAKAPTKAEPTKEILEKALKDEPKTRQKIQYNQVMAQLQNRDLIKSAMEPLEKINKSEFVKQVEEKIIDEKYDRMLSELGQ